MGKLRNTLDDVENRPRPRVMADGSKSFPEKLPDREGTGRSVNVLGGIAGRACRQFFAQAHSARSSIDRREYASKGYRSRQSTEKLFRTSHFS